VVKAAFGRRRKTLRNALSQSDLNLEPPTCEQLLKKAQIDPMRRAESLSVSSFVRLSNIIGSHRQADGTGG
jgi:16S rRNA (adenine1518-N6/adenine1519-N6)-dimethyltransferase